MAQKQIETGYRVIVEPISLGNFGSVRMSDRLAQPAAELMLNGMTEEAERLGLYDEPAAAVQLVAHEWDADGERCRKCGDKDWMQTACPRTAARPQRGGRPQQEHGRTETVGRQKKQHGEGCVSNANPLTTQTLPSNLQPSQQQSPNNV